MMHVNGEGRDRESRRTYELIDEHIAAPPLPGTVEARPTVDDVIDALAADLIVHSENCVREFGDFHLALSGGSTPVPLYERLMYDPDCRRVPWRRTHLWIVDERCVPFDDERSNFRMIRETIVDHADIPPEQVHPVFATADDADSDYERRIKEQMLWREKGQDRLDFVLLGMGADGHTASLFPGSAALDETIRLVKKVHYDAVDPPDRITMTYNLINAARFVAVLVTGAKKAAMLDRVATGRDSSRELPIKGVAPTAGELKWYLDAGACGSAASHT